MTPSFNLPVAPPQPRCSEDSCGEATKEASCCWLRGNARRVLRLSQALLKPRDAVTETSAARDCPEGGSECALGLLKRPCV